MARNGIDHCWRNSADISIYACSSNRYVALRLYFPTAELVADSTHAVGRVITGFGTGIDSSTVPMYQSELCKKEWRGRIVAWEIWVSSQRETCKEVKT